MLNEIVQRFFLTGSSVRWALQKPIVEHLLGNNLGRVLDIGAGGGMYALHKHRKPNTLFVRADAQDLPFGDKVFDTVLCTEVIEHLKNDKKAMNEMGRVLRDKGTLILSVPHPPAPYPDRFHIRVGYTLEELEHLLQGFRIITSASCMFFLFFLLLTFRWHFRQLFHFSPPILPLVYIERWKKWGIPFSIIVKAEKQCSSQ
ncbi:MAG: class I SAM-dependent methyltransferase [Candidatus Stahlbacteria bacterium]|nr:class I SAM-dependent methyltransferase [Candidatus Stahlbacteria bacterium]